MVYRIGKIIGRFVKGYRFVINKEGDDFVFYAHEIDSSFLPDSIEIEKRFGLEKVVGKGMIDHAAGGPTYLGVWSGPLDDTPATKELMENFESQLLEEYKKICPGIQKIMIFCKKQNS
ncbi:MAG: hypothetical protein Q8N99_08195 [Nanoarchaeota archaeon]|nr:hypothetical protein [Nanoarchaeota archaeon]